jgi:hypothetical protein
VRLNGTTTWSDGQVIIHDAGAIENARHAARHRHGTHAAVVQAVRRRRRHRPARVFAVLAQRA